MKSKGLKLRKLLAVMMALCLAVGILVVQDVSVMAAGEEFEYRVLNDGTIEITKYRGTDTEVIIPSEIDGYKVTGIGSSAFYNCSSLNSVTIPEGVTSIGERAFCLCSGLESITISKSVTDISGNVFAECPRLNSIIVDDDSKYFTSMDGVLYNKDITRLVVCPKKQTEITIPESVTSIDEEAFSRCQSLKNIVIPNGVLSIGKNAFEYCVMLNSITIPESVISIGENAFMMCLKLDKIILDEKNEQYTLIDDILYDKNVEKLIVCPRKKTEVYIPQSVTMIGESAFSGCKKLSTIIIPEGVAKIPYSAFCGCSNLNDITIPKGVVSIDMYAFAYCSSLRSIEIPEQVTSINYFAFGGCYNLTLVNNSSVILDLNRISTTAQWYDTATGELIDKLAKGSAIAIPNPIEIQKTDVDLDNGSQFVDKHGNKVDTDNVVIIKSSITQEQEDIIHAVEEITQNAAEKSKTFYYDISAYINAIGGAHAILSGNLTMKLPYPDGVTKDHDIIVLHNTSRIKDEDVKKYDGYFTLKTDGFSPFTIIALEAGTSSESGKPSDNTAVRDFVNRLYTLVLGREAEESGLESWTNALISKQSNGVDAGYGFVFSDECKQKNLSNDDFVEILYNTFMNRASDEGGKTAWVSQLDAGVEREKIFEGFIYSAEFAGICADYGINVGSTSDVGALENALSHYRNQNADITKFVARCYTEAMGRDYESEGLEAWCKVIIEKSNTPKQVAQNFIFSEEFTLKNLSDEEYVQVLYRTFMGREADEGGLAAWVDVLKSGREDRAKVLEGFSDSVEFDGILQSFGLN